MQIYFGRVPHNEVSAEYDYFAHEDSLGDQTHYWYGVEYGTGPEGVDGITIYDSVNRSIPIDIDSVSELILALQEVLVWQQDFEDYKSIAKKITNENFAIGIQEQSA